MARGRDGIIQRSHVPVLQFSMCCADVSTVEAVVCRLQPHPYTKKTWFFCGTCAIQTHVT